MKLRRLTASLAAVAALTSFGTAKALTVIDFTATPAGAKAEGFTATGFPQLEFYTDLGTGLLEVDDYGVQSQGNGLLVRSDTNGNFLKGKFKDGTHQFLSMTFGNDDPFFSNPGDMAVLTLYLGANLVGSTKVLFNRNDVMDQTIGFAFGKFDNWTLAYTNGAGNPFTGGGGSATGLIEIVDNITFDDGVFSDPHGGVPEPASWAMMLLGFGGMGALLRQRRRLAQA